MIRFFKSIALARAGFVCYNESGPSGEFLPAEGKPENEGKSMKSTGITRKIDELGRIVLPISIREELDLKSKDSVEIFTDGDRIVLKKYVPSCIFCGESDDVIYFREKRICQKCLRTIKDIT